MIEYDGGIWSVLSLNGSVFPSAFLVAFPCGVVSCALKICVDSGYLLFLGADEQSILRNNSMWNGFSSVVGFLIIFRTSQSYNRFWEGVHQTFKLRADWLDACSSLMAFSRYSDNSDVHHTQIHDFQQALVRLLSILHAVALAALESVDGDEFEETAAFKYEILDANGMTDDALLVVLRSPCRVHLVYQWIQLLVVDNIKKGVLTIPPPILSRSFQELSNGMVAFNAALKIKSIPFPFAYAQMCDFALILHWFWTPILCCSWSSHPASAGCLSFCAVFIFWALNFVAVEIENPFGTDANDISSENAQEILNEELEMLVIEAAERRQLFTKTQTTRRGERRDTRGQSFAHALFRISEQGSREEPDDEGCEFKVDRQTSPAHASGAENATLEITSDTNSDTSVPNWNSINAGVVEPRALKILPKQRPSRVLPRSWSAGSHASMASSVTNITVTNMSVANMSSLKSTLTAKGSANAAHHFSEKPGGKIQRSVKRNLNSKLRNLIIDLSSCACRCIWRANNESPYDMHFRTKEVAHSGLGQDDKSPSVDPDCEGLGGKTPKATPRWSVSQKSGPARQQS